MKFWEGAADEQRLYAEKSLIFDATELVAEAMEERGWTRKQLANALNVRASEITQRLRGKRNLTLRSLANMLHVMGYEVRLAKVDRTSQATWSPVTAGVTITVQTITHTHAPGWSITPGSSLAGVVTTGSSVTTGGIPVLVGGRES
jgi:plasmid maintenance system antidote protein VapI